MHIYIVVSPIFWLLLVFAWKLSANELSTTNQETTIIQSDYETQTTISTQQFAAEDPEINCPDEWVTDHLGEAILWSTKGLTSHTNIVSTPLCLDNNKFLITRKCENGAWIPPLTPNACQFSHPTHTNKNCPNGMFDIYGDNHQSRTICVKLVVSLYSKISNNQCAPLTGATTTVSDLDPDDFKEVFRYTSHVLGQYAFWLPAKWVNSTSIRWMLPGRFGQIEVVNTNQWSIGQATFQGKGCVFVQQIGEKLVISNRPCNQIFMMLCVYAEQTPLLKLACLDTQLTTRYSNGQYKCYSISQNGTGALTLLTIASSDMTLIASSLLSRTMLNGCVFDPFNAYARFPITLRQWNIFFSDINQYVHWAPEAKYDLDEDSILIANDRAEWMFSEDPDPVCYLVQNNTVLLPFHSPAMSIVKSPIDVDNNFLQLNVEHIDLFWHEDNKLGIHCFQSTDIHSSETSVDLIETSEIVGEEINIFSIADIGVGFYWCEAFTVGDMRHITTEKVYIDVADMFAGSVTRRCACLDNLIDVESWFQDALNQSNHPVRLANFTLVNWSRFKIYQTGFIQIWFRVSVQSLAVGDERIPSNEETLQFMDHHMLRVWRKQEILEDILRTSPFHFPVINSTEFCLPEIQTTTNTLMLMGARIGQTRTPTHLCLLDSGLPVVLLCDGDSEVGASWRYLTDSTCSQNSVPRITQELFNITADFQHANETRAVMEQVRTLTENNIINPIDLYSIGNIMQRTAILNNDGALNAAAVDDMFSIYDRMMSTDVRVTREASVLNATNVLLDSFGTIVDNLQANADFNGRDNFQTHIIDPGQKNITGVAVYKNGSTMYLFHNQSINTLLHHPDLVAATYLPENVINLLPHLSKLVVTMFNNDVMFQTPTVHESNLNQTGLIISVSIPNINTNNLPEPIPIFFKYDDYPDKHKACYWVFDNHDSWMPDGIHLVTNTSTIFQFNVTHLTNFALLIRGSKEVDTNHSDSLFLITIICSSTSLLGIIGILITAIRFAAWREKASNLLLLQLSLALALMLILFCVIGTEFTLKNIDICITLGAILHYLVLVNFMWMLVMAYLQFMRYVIVFIQIRSERYVLKLSCISWAIPIIPVMTLLIIDPMLYVPGGVENQTPQNQSICYPNGTALLLSVVLPISLIIICNLLIFVVVIYNLCQIQKANRSILLGQLRVSAFLFFLLGLTWTFGLFSHVDGFSLVFTYLFCLTATLQGFVLFVYFILMDRGTRQLWSKDIKLACGIGRRGSMSVDTMGNSKQTY